MGYSSFHWRSRARTWWFQFVPALIWKSSRLFGAFLLEFRFLHQRTGSSLISLLWSENTGCLMQRFNAWRVTFLKKLGLYTSLLSCGPSGIYPEYPTRCNNWWDSCLWRETPCFRWQVLRAGGRWAPVSQGLLDQWREAKCVPVNCIWAVFIFIYTHIHIYTHPFTQLVTALPEKSWFRLGFTFYQRCLEERFFLRVGIRGQRWSTFWKGLYGNVVDLWKRMSLLLTGCFDVLQESVNTTEKLHKGGNKALVPKMCICHISWGWQFKKIWRMGRAVCFCVSYF